MRPILKLSWLGTLIGLFLLTTLPIPLFFWSAGSRRRARVVVTRWWTKWFLGALALEVSVTGAGDTSGPCLIVANHLSYLDVFAIFRACEAVFVTSNEVKQDAFLGTICRLAGCAFVERRNRNGIRDQIAEVSRLLRSGLSVVVFPEGTSSNGESVLPFKRGLLAAACEAQVPVMPLCINYREVDGRQLSSDARDSVFWYGGMDFFPHLLRVMGLRRVRVEIERLPLISLTDRSLLADAAHASIRSRYVSVI